MEPKRYEVTGDWRRLHNGELYDLYSSFNIIRVSKSGGWDGRGMRYVWGRGQVNTGFLFRKCDRKRTFGKPTSRWYNNIKWVFRKLGGGMDWIALVQDRDKRRALVNVVMNIRVP